MLLPSLPCRPGREQSLRDRPGVRGALALLLVLAAWGCEDTRTQALSDLRSPMAEVRADALRRLGRSGREEDLPLLVKGTQDPSSLVRRSAVDAIAAMRDPRGVDVLAELLADPDPDVQTAAAQGLSHMPSPKARPYLTSSFARRGPTCRAAVAEALEESGVPLAEPVRSEAKLLWERNLQAITASGMAERVGAAEELGRSGRPEAIERLRPLLADPSVLLAAAAIRGLGSAGAPSARTLLEPILDDEFPQLREAAAEALGQLGDAASAPALGRAAGSASPAAASAAAALVKLPESGGAACLAALTAQKVAAAQLLARHAVATGATCDRAPLLARVNAGGADALPALAAAGPLKVTAALPKALELALDEATPIDLRVAAIQFLGEAGGAPEAAKLEVLFQGLASRLSAGRSDWVKENLPREFLTGFAPVGGDDGYGAKYEELMKRVEEQGGKAEGAARLLQGTSSDRSQVELVDDLPAGTVPLLAATMQSLGALFATGSASQLAAVLSDEDAELRAAAAAGLGALGAEAGLVLLRKLALEDRSPEVRAAAIDALARKGGPAEVELLVQVALSTDMLSKIRALRALGDRREAKIPPEAVLAFARSGLPDAALALGKLGFKDAAPALVQALKTPVVAGRLEVIEALGKIGGPEAEAALQRELFHDRPEIRSAAAAALGKLKSSKARKALEALASEDYYGEVRAAATRALVALDVHATDGK